MIQKKTDCYAFEERNNYRFVISCEHAIIDWCIVAFYFQYVQLAYPIGLQTHTCSVIVD